MTEAIWQRRKARRGNIANHRRFCISGAHRRVWATGASRQRAFATYRRARIIKRRAATSYRGGGGNNVLSASSGSANGVAAASRLGGGKQNIGEKGGRRAAGANMANMAAWALERRGRGGGRAGSDGARIRRQKQAALHSRLPLPLCGVLPLWSSTYFSTHLLCSSCMLLTCLESLSICA